ncbi:butyrophilin-like protein 1 [Rhynchocyon petersi]
MGSSEKFQVQCPLHPIVAVLGGDATLTCSLYPVMNAENMELRWFRSQISEAVFVYQHQQEQKEEQLPQYTGRTSLVKDMLSYGEATIHINEVQVSDDGLYTCFFKHGGFYEESTLELRVAGVGSVPEVHIQGPEEDGVRVVCTTSAWFPKPQVQWRNLNGEKLLGFSEIHAQDTEGLFHVETSLVVRSSTAGNVTCSILNHILGQEKSMAIFIPEPFFPQASPWIPAFLVSTTMLGLLILGVGYFIRKERSATLQLRKEQLTLQQLKEEDRQRKEKALEIRDEFQAELNRRKKIYQADMRTPFHGSRSGDSGKRNLALGAL